MLDPGYFRLRLSQLIVPFNSEVQKKQSIRRSNRKVKKTLSKLAEKGIKYEFKPKVLIDNSVHFTNKLIRGSQRALHTIFLVCKK